MSVPATQKPAVRVVEVGPRDGLQSRGIQLSIEQRVEWIRKLIAAGIGEIEAGAFVRPDRVPAMADSDQLFLLLGDVTPVKLWALIPNPKGAQRAVASGAKHLAFFTAASETFSQQNSGCSIDQSLHHFRQLRSEASDVPLRGYLSCSFGCPYEGVIDPDQVLLRSLALLRDGADEIVISDTTGIATAQAVTTLIARLATDLPIEKISLHLHDTHGSALDCARAGLDAGIRSFDASAGGLGGCPFAPGARGNVATEDLLEVLEQQGFESGIDRPTLIETSLWLERCLGEELPARSLVDRR
ncbi:MAG: hydroxymethylglutaryl-CoA lyase [Planctomycetota bacterium]|nr:hydroxymethylglutaryl-CoA lyase [Planctomycetota bacterium]